MIYLIWSAMLCSSVWSTTEPQNKDFLFLGFFYVSQANMAIMNVPPLG
jgi:hypothetical protein